MEKSFLFDAVRVDGVWDRKYLAQDYTEYFSSFIGNGVFPNPSTNLQVVAVDDFNISVLAGKAFINGRIYRNTDTLVFTLDVADGVLNRIDTVVVQVNHLAREIKTVIKKGTFAVNPIPPELTNNADFEEIQLAEVYVKAGSIKITQADITDTRLNKDLCGIVHGTVDQIDTTTLFNQYKSWYEYTTGKAVEDMQAFQNQFRADMLAWANELKTLLDDNAAINLLNKINALEQSTNTALSEKADKTQLGINATATYSNNVVSITAPPDAVQIIFIAPSDFTESDTYTLNGTAITITNLNNEPLSDSWKSGVPVPLTIKDGKAFFRSGGGSYGTLSPQVRNFVAKAGNHEIKLNWTNPTDSNHAGTYIVRKQGSQPTKLSDGVKIDVGMATNYTDNEPECDKLYYYRAFTYNAKKQVQTELTGAVVSATPKAGVPLKNLPVGTTIRVEENGKNMIYHRTYTTLCFLRDDCILSSAYNMDSLIQTLRESFLPAMDNLITCMQVPNISILCNAPLETDAKRNAFRDKEFVNPNGDFLLSSSKSGGHYRVWSYNNKWTTLSSTSVACKIPFVIYFKDNVLVNPVPNADGSYNIIFG